MTWKDECAARECTSPVGPKGAKGLCSKHYHNLRARGNAESDAVPPTAISYMESRIDRSGPMPDYTDPLVTAPPVACWLWLGAKGQQGYGMYSRWESGTKVQQMAHRAVWKWLIGPIGGGLTLDHLCRNRICVNPAHLEQVTNRENILRGAAPAAVHARKTHCPKGHAFDAENTYRWGGLRYCRQCRREYSRSRYTRRG